MWWKGGKVREVETGRRREKSRRASVSGYASPSQAFSLSSSLFPSEPQTKPTPPNLPKLPQPISHSIYVGVLVIIRPRRTGEGTFPCFYCSTMSSLPFILAVALSFPSLLLPKDRILRRWWRRKGRALQWDSSHLALYRRSVKRTRRALGTRAFF